MTRGSCASPSENATTLYETTLDCTNGADRPFRSRVAARHRLLRHLVLQPAEQGRVRLQVQRRFRDLPATAVADRDLRARGEEDLLLLRRDSEGEAGTAAHGVVLRPHHRQGAEAVYPRQQENRRRA